MSDVDPADLVRVGPVTVAVLGIIGMQMAKKSPERIDGDGHDSPGRSGHGSFLRTKVALKARTSTLARASIVARAGPTIPTTESPRARNA